MLKQLAVWTIRGYQRMISRYTPPMCRFEPTCSQYAVVSVRRFGILRGGWMAALRLGRCHPFHPGGYDPVPCTEHGPHSHGPAEGRTSSGGGQP